MNMINVLIAGATGYIGIQLTKILAKHKNVKIKHLCGNSSIGKKISYFDKNLDILITVIFVNLNFKKKRNKMKNLKIL